MEKIICCFVGFRWEVCAKDGPPLCMGCKLCWGVKLQVFPSIFGKFALLPSLIWFFCFLFSFYAQLKYSIVLLHIFWVEMLVFTTWWIMILLQESCSGKIWMGFCLLKVRNIIVNLSWLIRLLYFAMGKWKDVESYHVVLIQYIGSLELNWTCSWCANLWQACKLPTHVSDWQSELILLIHLVTQTYNMLLCCITCSV